MKSKREVFIILFVLVQYFGSSSSETVSTEDGLVEGTVMISQLGASFNAFLRIPFAMPPVGDLRFQEPQPVRPWSGTLDATAYGPVCVQPNAVPFFDVSEDCLHLNVYSKDLTGSKPVIFFIHGGSFEFGTGMFEGPHYLMDRDLVVVTINYRLGSFGFLATGTKEAPGNAGMKDQVMALKWVNRNIARFGGDPNKITISGLSAGSVSVTALMVSPMARNLFHGVIAVSGTITGFNLLPSEYLDIAKDLSAKLNCATDNVEDMVACLKTKPALEIANVPLKQYPECEIATWIPNVEPDFGQERFLEDDPSKLVREGNFARVPIIIGRTADEFSNIVPSLLNSPGLQIMNENFDEIAPHCFFYEKNTSKSRAIGRILRDLYLPFDTIDVRSFAGLNQLFSDSIIGYNVHKFAHLAANFTDVYYYKFSYVGRYSMFYYPHDKPFGVHHADDLQYAINAAYIGPMIGPSDPENIMVERMTRIYEQFAHNRNPNYDLQVMSWPKLDLEQEYYMEIGTHMVEKHGMMLDRYTVWESMDIPGEISMGEIVDTEAGPVEGTVMSSRLGNEFYAFLQIPYAEVPIGDLRFQEPRERQPWTEVRNGMVDGPMCFQANASPDAEMSEDCLHLNIYTRSLTESLPVIFFVHGGAFASGTGHAQGPEYLMDRDVVVVTINYRLGALGFLATGTKEAPGNAGMKDQAMALKWVRRNIARFGGDPNKITISGFSAGARAVTALMLSPMVKNLFSGVIAISGSITGFNPTRGDYLDLARKLSSNLSCTTDGIDDMIACLKTKSPLEIVNVRLMEHPECEIVVWRPVIESDFGQERFFDADPIKVINDGNFTKVPIIIGRTADEFVDVVPRFLNSPGLQQMNENFDEIAPHCFVYDGSTEKLKENGKTLRDSYLPFDVIDVRSFTGLSNLIGDANTGYNVHRFAHLLSNHSDVFYYKFSYVGRHSLFKYPNGKPYGVHHADDLQYVFNTSFIGPMIEASDPESFMVERMTKIFEHFAWNGNPNYNLEEFSWPKLDYEEEFYLDIGLHMVEKHGLMLDRYSVWDRLETSSASAINLGVLLSLTIVMKWIWF